MKMTITESKFIVEAQLFSSDWTNEELKILYKHYKEEEDRTGIETELNVFSIISEWDVSTPIDLWNRHSNCEFKNGEYSLDAFKSWIHRVYNIYNDNSWREGKGCYWLSTGEVLYTWF